MQLEDYLREAVVTDDDPAILLDWSEAVVDAFVAIANAGKGAGGGPLPALPTWVTSAAGAMSRASFTRDVITFCSAVGGGSVGVVLIAPNDLRQFHLVSRRFQQVESDGYVQSCLTQLADGQVLARLYYLSDRSIARAQPLNSAPPPGNRMFFS